MDRSVSLSIKAWNEGDSARKVLSNIKPTTGCEPKT